MKLKKTLATLCIASGLVSSISGQDNTLILNADQGNQTISKHIYGHFSEHLGHCIYGGFWVGEDSPIPNTRGIRNDVVKALKDIQIPNLRWPGGCFADEYHWRDGIGPRSERPKMVNTHWGGVVEDNAFGTHEFMDLCEQLECEPYICGNVGSGSVEEMSKWVEYLTFDGESPMSNLRRKNGRERPWKVKFWGVGNENWGCGGNMTADFYTDQYRRYATYCRNYGDNRLYKIAGGANSDDYYWTETLMKKIGRQMQGLSLHYYTVPRSWNQKGSATQFDKEEYLTTIEKAHFMGELVQKHATIMDKYDPEKKISLIPDEWGTWYDVEPGTNPGFLYQQNTLRDAIVAGVTLNIFNNHCDRVHMANIAQTINVLQAVILTQEDKMVLTPTYWVYYLYKVHQEATMIPLHFTGNTIEHRGIKMNAISASASKSADGKIHITLVNIDPDNSQSLKTVLNGIKAKKITGKLLSSAKINDHNTFDAPETVKLKDFKDAKIVDGNLSVNLPSKSVVLLEIEL
ncbi:MAG: alpha-N-arabinofuranosidase [Massilibacteroides sp.]|nr:alpha-N-arabinofuranosidase [Massilibacteroides sp.]MDD3061579.1 alpha-N-arabinofuranosidase [Massilibacteroides sp.]MDD4114943.1 alpha-N-arabinofuranosidase [Massilibacteroides sp.]MDD4659132.1 alpha-N-arabinofuranosidase [Massilibacteroides sp.]